MPEKPRVKWLPCLSVDVVDAKDWDIFLLKLYLEYKLPRMFSMYIYTFASIPMCVYKKHTLNERGKEESKQLHCGIPK